LQKGQIQPQKLLAALTLKKIQFDYSNPIQNTIETKYNKKKTKKSGVECILSSIISFGCPEIM